MPNPLLPLIPFPQEIVFHDGLYSLPASIGIFYHPIFKNEILYFQQRFPLTHSPQVVYLKEEANLFLHHIDEPVAKPGSYRLVIRPQDITLCAAEKTGIFSGLQTLFQIMIALTHNFSQPASLPCLTIHDYPRFDWRGFMLDEARHFQGAQTVRNLLDWMAYLKMNIFHWHLSDDQGWRLESKCYPQLAEVASRRAVTQKGGFLNRRLAAAPQEKFYTQDEIKAIIDYASERHITIVPEIDVPGHSSALLAAFPHLGCTGGPYNVQPYWGIHKEILCAGNPATYEFLDTLFGELMELFPGQYIHAGGDEVPKIRWKACPKCRVKAQELGYAHVQALQTHIANHLNRLIQANGRTMLAWNEILAHDLAPEVVVQYWLGNKKTLGEHIKRGRQAILSNFHTFYLDHSYSHSGLPKVYRSEPVFSQIDKESHENILGMEAPLWSEYVPSRERLDWQVFPRLLAVAESAWLDPQKKDYGHFRRRLVQFLPQLDQDGIQYTPLSASEPGILQRLGAPFSLLREGTAVRE